VKFTKALENAYLLFEQEPPTASALPDAAMPQGEEPGVQKPGPDNGPEREKFTPEGKVMLVRLLLKAFVVSPSAEDASEISKLEDVNANNASEILQKLTSLMRKYTELDINTPGVD
jgi:hypothetical protein